MKKYKFIQEFDEDAFTHAVETAMEDLGSKGARNFKVTNSTSTHDERYADGYGGFEDSYRTVYSAIILYEIEEREPERKEASWLPLFNGEFTGGAYWFKCSECGRIVPDVRNGGWRFCPNCGVDMMS